MAELNRMMYCVTQSGYSVQIGDGVIVQQLDGGAPRFRRTLKGTVHTAAVQWIVQSAGYQYLMAFYRVWARNPSQPFLCKLCIDDAPVQDYQCYFSGSPKLTSKEADVFTVGATLIVKPLETSDEIDDLIVAVGNQDQNLSSMFNPFEELVNQDLPNAMQNVPQRYEELNHD